MTTKTLLEKQKNKQDWGIQTQSQEVRNDKIIQESRFKHYRFHLCIRRQRETDSITRSEEPSCRERV